MVWSEVFLTRSRKRTKQLFVDRQLICHFTNCAICKKTSLCLQLPKFHEVIMQSTIISPYWCKLRTVYIETSYHFGSMYTTLFAVLLEKQCFKFVYEFFYGAFEVDCM